MVGIVTEEQSNTAIELIKGIHYYNLDISKMPMKWIRKYNELLNNIKTDKSLTDRELEIIRKADKDYV